MPGRLKLLISYDGRPFRGWQSQSGGKTVQDYLEAALATLCGGERIVVHGAGRTDAGVHARGQVAHVEVPERARFTPARWAAALNAHLPPEIRVERVRLAAADFHARFSARGKVYRYRIWNAPIHNPFEIGRAWHVPGELDFATLHGAGQLFVGTHDFAAFAANRGKAEPNTVRAISRVLVRRAGALVTVEVAGDGFLYKMVRLMVGTLVRVGLGRMSAKRISELLAQGAAGPKATFAAPAEGLYLMRVIY